MKNYLGGGYSLKKILLISIVVIGLTLILLNNFSHAFFTSSISVPFANGNINYKHPDFKIVSMFQKTSDGYTEVNTMPNGNDYVINSSKSYCTKGFTEEKDTNAVLKTVNGNHVMNNLTKNDRCTIYFDYPPILSQKWFDLQESENAITKSDVESIITLDKIDIPDNAIKSWDASEANNGSVMAYYTDKDSNGKYELYLAGEGSVIAPTDSSNLFGGTLYVSIFNELDSISLSHLDTSRVTNMSNMFLGITLINVNGLLDFSNFDTRNVTNMSGMFADATNINGLDISSFDTSKVTDMSNMFKSIQIFENLNLSNFDTSKVTNMSGMFESAYAVGNIDLSDFDTSKVTDMSMMFAETGIESLDISNFDTSNVTNMSGMFAQMTNLTNLNLSNFDTSNVVDTSVMFAGLNLETLDLRKAIFTNVTNFEGIFQETTIGTIIVGYEETAAFLYELGAPANQIEIYNG